jgi:hypothetical protein
MPTFTNPADSTQTYTTGKRGRCPRWLDTLPEYIAYKTTKEATKAPPKPITTTSTGLLCWRYVGLFDEKDGEIRQPVPVCVVAAHHDLEAMALLAKRFPNAPVPSKEFNLMWKRLDVELATPGVYEHNAEKILTLKVPL